MIFQRAVHFRMKRSELSSASCPTLPSYVLRDGDEAGLIEHLLKSILSRTIWPVKGVAFPSGAS
jgi:hypothetical protein